MTNPPSPSAAMPELEDCNRCENQGTVDDPLSSAMGGRWFRYCDCEHGAKALNEDMEAKKLHKPLPPAQNPAVERAIAVIQEIKDTHEKLRRDTTFEEQWIAERTAQFADKALEALRTLPKVADTVGDVEALKRSMHRLIPKCDIGPAIHEMNAENATVDRVIDELHKRNLLAGDHGGEGK